MILQRMKPRCREGWVRWFLWVAAMKRTHVFTPGRHRVHVSDVSLRVHLCEYENTSSFRVSLIFRIIIEDGENSLSLKLGCPVESMNSFACIRDFKLDNMQ